MKRRYFWLTGIGVIIVIIVAGVAVYAAHFASTVNPSHQAAGAINVTATSSTGGQMFQIVSAQTTASYSVFENQIAKHKPNNDAVGTTHSVQGVFRVQTGSSPFVAGMNITVDLRTLQTDSTFRDQYIQKNTLQTSTYPYATFVSVSTQGLPTSYSDGQTVHFQIIGNLTMHGKTNKETFDVQGKVANNTITGTANTTVFMTDFGMQPPNLVNIVVAQNKVALTLNFTAKAQ